uniref:Kunitz-type serine protease inhibitor 2 n=1 Tax=Drosophila rhopaloa TaxID=1041015 RepID=A0A6P4FFI7_DRORH
MCDVRDLGRSQDQYEKEQFKIRKSVCVQNSEYGKCEGHRRLWYYNVNRAKCQTFIYSNCGGNGNLFFTRESCQEFCGKYNWKRNQKAARQRMAVSKS